MGHRIPKEISDWYTQRLRSRSGNVWLPSSGPVAEAGWHWYLAPLALCPHPTGVPAEHIPYSESPQPAVCVSAKARVWAGDPTFIPTRTGWLTVAVFLNLYSRQVMGLAMSRRSRHLTLI